MFTSLRRRLIVLVLIPTALLLAAVGVLGFFYATDEMLDQWREASLLKLERAAHFIQMRFRRPLDRIGMVITTPGLFRDADRAKHWIVRELEELEGISRVQEVSLAGTDSGTVRTDPILDQMIPMEQFNRAILASISVIGHGAETGGGAVSLYINFRDGTSRRFGHAEVIMPFDYLLQDIQELGWWQSDMACVVDGAGAYLSHTGAMAPLMAGRRKLGETGDELELAVLDAMGEDRSGTVMGSGHPPGHVAGFYRLGQAPWWTIIMFAPGGEILKPIVHFAAYYSLAGGVCVTLILVLIRLVEGRTVRSIKDVSEVAHMISKGVYGEPVPERGRDEISQLIRSFNTMTEGLKERDRIADTFGRYMDPGIAQELMRSPEALRLGGQKRDVTILMSDIRGFSAIAESLTPEQTITLINRYFSRMIEEIQKHRGIIVDFFGDGILAFFDPLGGELQATTARAVRCALAMQRAAEDLNSENERRGLPQLQTGIGVHVGTVVVGNVGSETRAKYGIVGSAVNVTQRIETEANGGEILVSESAYQRIADQVTLKRSVERDLKGVQEKMKLYVVAGLSS